MYYTKEDVAKLVAAIGESKSGDGHNVNMSALEVGPAYRFGLSLEVFDPESGVVITACRPQRPDTGEAEIFLTPAQIAVAVMNARSTRLHNERAGLVPPRALTPEQEAAAEKARTDAVEKQRVADEQKAAASKAA